MTILLQVKGLASEPPVRSQRDGKADRKFGVVTPIVKLHCYYAQWGQKRKEKGI